MPNTKNVNKTSWWGLLLGHGNSSHCFPYPVSIQNARNKNQTNKQTENNFINVVLSRAGKSRFFLGILVFFKPKFWEKSKFGFSRFFKFSKFFRINMQVYFFKLVWVNQQFHHVLTPTVPSPYSHSVSTLHCRSPKARSKNKI